MRFDMRAPGPATPTDLYRTAIEMCEWGEDHGCLAVMVNEHHSAADGYNPSPLILATAIAARTAQLPISVAALLVNMYDPVKLAEDMVVLDIVSGGRVSYVVGMGYRPEEYAMFGVDFTARGLALDDKLEALLRAVRGDEFVWHGRTVKVTPAASTPGGPVIMYGGGSPAGLRRAKRLGMSVSPIAATSAKDGAATSPRMPTTVFVAEDVEAAWKTLGPHMLHDATTYAQWMGDDRPLSRSDAGTVEEMRAEQGAYRILTPDEAIAMVRGGGFLSLQPLCGGLDPDLAWQSLRLVGETVVPALQR